MLESEAKQILDRARKRLRRRGVTAAKLQSAWGDPAQVIIDTVRREKADILVIGRRGRGRLAGLLLGSVSQKLTSLAAEPIEFGDDELGAMQRDGSSLAVALSC